MDRIKLSASIFQLEKKDRVMPADLFWHNNGLRTSMYWTALTLNSLPSLTVVLVQ
jgi:hypothetical protein